MRTDTRKVPNKPETLMRAMRLYRGMDPYDELRSDALSQARRSFLTTRRRGESGVDGVSTTRRSGLQTPTTSVNHAARGRQASTGG